MGNHLSVTNGDGNFIGMSKFSNKGALVLKKYLIEERKNRKEIKRIFESNELMKRLTSNAYKKASITHDPSKNYQDLISCYQNILRDEI